jgi:hypothetical protein
VTEHRQGRLNLVLPIVVSAAAIGLAIAHLASPGAAIDGTTLALVGIAALPWLGSVFKSIELPGGVKAEYRERLETVEAKVADVERALFRGASPALQETLNETLGRFGDYLSSIGMTDTGAIPVVDVSGAPEGMLAAYDQSTNSIFVDPRLADDPAHTLHEYAHLVLLRAAKGAYQYGSGGLDAVEGGLANYFVCGFQNSPRLYADNVWAHDFGLDAVVLDRHETTAELSDPSDDQERGRIWAEVLWSIRTVGSSTQVDTAIANAWTATSSAGDTEEAKFVAALSTEVVGMDHLADLLSKLVTTRGLAASGEPTQGT